VQVNVYYNLTESDCKFLASEFNKTEEVHLKSSKFDYFVTLARHVWKPLAISGTWEQNSTVAIGGKKGDKWVEKLGWNIFGWGERESRGFGWMFQMLKLPADEIMKIVAVGESYEDTRNKQNAESEMSGATSSSSSQKGDKRKSSSVSGEDAPSLGKFYEFSLHHIGDNLGELYTQIDREFRLKLWDDLAHKKLEMHQIAKRCNSRKATKAMRQCIIAWGPSTSEASSWEDFSQATGWANVENQQFWDTYIPLWIVGKGKSGRKVQFANIYLATHRPDQRME